MRSDDARARRGLLPAAATAAACVLLAACAMQFNSRSLGVPVTMAAGAALGVPGDTFTVTTHAVWLFWGLAPTKQPSLQQTLAGQLGAGAGVNNLSVRARMRWSDVLVTALSLGIVSTTSVTYSGVIARAGP